MFAWLGNVECDTVSLRTLFARCLDGDVDSRQALSLMRWRTHNFFLTHMMGFWHGCTGAAVATVVVGYIDGLSLPNRCAAFRDRCDSGNINSQANPVGVLNRCIVYPFN